MEPYKFKKIIFNDGFLNKSVDATYIIHLENNGRYEHIQKQLMEYHPTNIVYILFNKGYKKSKKKEFINNPPLDLVDAFLEIFNHANNKKYNNILILEDDFIFSKKIKDNYHINNINNIINKLGNKEFMYLLGCLPGILIPYDKFNYRVTSIGTHAVIYSLKFRINILKTDQKIIFDWDGYNNKFKRYTYYLPLCYQLFSETENSKNWGYCNLISKCHSFFVKLTIKLLKLDKQVEPGTSICYNLSKIVIIIIFIIFVYLIHRFYKKINIFK
jgi:hypothetical protein